MLRLALLLSFALYLEAASALVESRAEGRFALDGQGETMLIDFRPDSIRGWKIAKARLYLYVVSGPAPAQLPVSTVTVNWSEDKPAGAAKGAFGKGGSSQVSCAVKPLPQGWIEVELPSAFLEAMAAGKSYGLAWRGGATRINGRAPAFRQPYILAEGDPSQ
ncbi:MAG: hypothetical protein JNK48_01270 [Bryobacterales bacterium]|nr:hypothetical protein [Bryobacterales bacterium]